MLLRFRPLKALQQEEGIANLVTVEHACHKRERCARTIYSFPRFVESAGKDSKEQMVSIVRAANMNARSDFSNPRYGCLFKASSIAMLRVTNIYLRLEQMMWWFCRVKHQNLILTNDMRIYGGLRASSAQHRADRVHI